MKHVEQAAHNLLQANPNFIAEIQQSSAQNDDEFEVFGSFVGGGPNVRTEIQEIMNCKSSLSLLEFWATRGDDYPILKKLANRYLAIPATSASSERVFSGVKLFEHRLRGNLGSEKINNMALAKTYLKKNFPTVFNAD